MDGTKLLVDRLSSETRFSIPVLELVSGDLLVGLCETWIKKSNRLSNQTFSAKQHNATIRGDP